MPDIVIWGERANGTRGVLSSQGFVDFIVGKIGHGSPAWRTNIRGAADDILDGGGTGSGVHHKGKVVRHVTHGAGANHVAVFFTKEDPHVVSIIGLGSHNDASGARYDIDWHIPSWDVSRVNL
jgi:hypothetical protein